MNPSAYLNLADRIKKQEKMLSTFPKSFIDFKSNVPLKYCYKTFHVGNYTAFFYIDENENIVYVRRILYSGMDLKNMFI
jgi:mRNA-degrading endonuclease RelE of RelBE toxin-antitoxin system